MPTEVHMQNFDCMPGEKQTGTAVSVKIIGEIRKKPCHDWDPGNPHCDEEVLPTLRSREVAATE
jgi:hypothetical protein